MAFAFSSSMGISCLRHFNSNFESYKEQLLNSDGSIDRTKMIELTNHIRYILKVNNLSLPELNYLSDKVPEIPDHLCDLFIKLDEAVNIINTTLLELLTEKLGGPEQFC